MKSIIAISLALLASQTAWAQSTVADCQKAFPPNTLPLTNCIKRVAGQSSVPMAPARPVVAPPIPPKPVQTPPPPLPKPIQPPPAPPKPVVQTVPIQPPKVVALPVPVRPVPTPPIAAPVKPPIAVPPAAAPVLNYSVSGGQNVRLNSPFDLIVNVSGGSPPATLAVIVPGAQFVSKNGNRFSFIAKTAGNQSYQVKESTNPTSRVLAAGAIVILAANAGDAGAITSAPAKISGSSLQGKAVVGQPITLLFTGQNLTKDVQVMASDCDTVGGVELVSSSQIKLICKLQKSGSITPSWRAPGNLALLKLTAIQGAVDSLSSWQQSIVDDVNSKIGSTDNVGGQCDPNAEYTYCYAWAWRAYNRVLKTSLSGHPTAYDAAIAISKQFPTKYRSTNNFADAPIGALVFFHKSKGNFQSGHASIKVSNTEMVNEGFGKKGDRCRITKNKFTDEPASVMGYFVP